MTYFKIKHYYNKGIKNPLYKDWQWQLILYILNKLNIIDDTKYQLTFKI